MQLGQLSCLFGTGVDRRFRVDRLSPKQHIIMPTRRFDYQVASIFDSHLPHQAMKIRTASSKEDVMQERSTKDAIPGTFDNGFLSLIRRIPDLAEALYARDSAYGEQDSRPSWPRFLRRELTKAQERYWTSLADGTEEARAQALQLLIGEDIDDKWFLDSTLSSSVRECAACFSTIMADRRQSWKQRW